MLKKFRMKIRNVCERKNSMIIFDIVMNIAILTLFTLTTLKISNNFNLVLFIKDVIFLCVVYFLLSSIKNDRARFITKSIFYPILLFMPYADLISYDYYTQVFRYYEIKNIGVLFRTFQIGFTIPLIQIFTTLVIIAAISLYVYTQALTKHFRIKFRIRRFNFRIAFIMAITPIVFVLISVLTIDPDDPNYYSSKNFLVREVYSNEEYIKNFGYSQFRIRKLLPVLKEKVTNEDRLDNYFKNKGIKEINEFSAKYEGYNVIHLMVESFDTKLFNEYSMPNLYGMYENSIVVDDYFVPEYQQGATCNSEFMANVSLYPISLNNTANIMCKVVQKDVVNYSLPRQMEELGYTTNYYHNGTKDFYNRDEMTTNTYGFQNSGFAKQSQLDRDVTDIELMKFINEMDFDKKFFTQILTYSMHVGGFTFTEEEKAYFEENLNIEDDDFYIDYLSKQLKTDELIGAILNKLEVEGILNNTLIVVTGDHYPYGFPGDNLDYLEVTGIDYVDSNDAHKQSLFIYDGGNTTGNYKIPSSTIDIAPTILNMVAGISQNVEYNYYLGNDIFDKKSVPSFSNYDIYYNDNYYGFDYYYEDKENDAIMNKIFLEQYNLRLLSDYIIEEKYSPIFR